MPTEISEQKGKELSKSLSSLLRTASMRFDGNVRDDGCVWKATEVARCMCWNKYHKGHLGFYSIYNPRIRKYVTWRPSLMRKVVNPMIRAHYINASMKSWKTSASSILKILLTVTLQPIRQGRGIKVSASWLFCYHSPLKCFRLQLNWRNSAKVRGSRCSMILAGSNLDSMQNFNLNVIR